MVCSRTPLERLTTPPEPPLVPVKGSGERGLETDQAPMSRCCDQGHSKFGSPKRKARGDTLKLGPRKLWTNRLIGMITDIIIIINIIIIIITIIISVAGIISLADHC